jgi:hypothetical protein
MEISNLVVARYTDGRVLKGVTQDFSPNRGIFHVHPEGAREAVELRFKQLKALFFVSSLEGDSERQDIRGFVAGPEETTKGKKIAVRFRDGELLCGYTLSWTPEREGFFVFPADTGSNNQRVFVITAATVEVKAGPAAEILAQRTLANAKPPAASEESVNKAWRPKLAPRPNFDLPDLPPLRGERTLPDLPPLRGPREPLGQDRFPPADDDEEHRKAS